MASAMCREFATKWSTLRVAARSHARNRACARNLPPNVCFAGRLDDAQTANLVGRARAFIFAAYEDFGIAPVEAQAAGTPVIAYREGGSSETIRGLESEFPTGVLFDAQTPDAIVAAVARFEASTIDSDACRINAARFSESRFRVEFAAYFGALMRERASPAESSATPNRRA